MQEQGVRSAIGHSRSELNWAHLDQRQLSRVHRQCESARHGQLPSSVVLPDASLNFTYCSFAIGALLPVWWALGDAMRRRTKAGHSRGMRCSRPKLAKQFRGRFKPTERRKFVGRHVQTGGTNRRVGSSIKKAPLLWRRPPASFWSSCHLIETRTPSPPSRDKSSLTAQFLPITPESSAARTLYNMTRVAGCLGSGFTFPRSV